MQGDFSRWTFDARARYRSVLLQQGRVLLDADWNEQAEITAHHDETRACDTFGRAGVPTGQSAFRIMDKTGKDPDGTVWADLRISRGRMYVDGVLVEAHGERGGIPLCDQPDLATITTVQATEQGLPEPTDDGTWAFRLHVRTHHVTVDEVEKLRESALGGPDTTTRARTVWQVTCETVPDGTVCSDLQPKPPGQGAMVAFLERETPDPDPCAITAAPGYTRLENQLYRVQIHESGKSFLWSRENGSVTAALKGISTTALPQGADAELIVDRVGRDEELSIGDGDIVEVTSTALQLHGKPGHLAKVRQPNGLQLPVVWLSGSGVNDLKALGEAPIVRRWEHGPVPVRTAKASLEGGIRVDFRGEDKLQTGDYWLIPARTARLAYGLTAESGTLDWPRSGGVASYVPPHGPERHVAPLAILKRETVGGTGRWTQVSDCRSIAPALTQLTTIDLVGGDGQEALPGKELPQPVRVVVRNGSLPVPKAMVLFTPNGGSVRDADHRPLSPGKPTPTNGDGVVEVWWTLDPGGAATQTLEAQRLNDHGAGIDVKVVATGRLSTAANVAWAPPSDCAPFHDAKTVQQALENLVTARELRLLGGDGQHLPGSEKVLPKQIRVIVDSPCGPVEGAKVTATATDGALVRRVTAPGEPRPLDLTGATGTATASAGSDGAVAFWWQPHFGADKSDVLSIGRTGDGKRAPIMVTAQRADVGEQPDGLHITGLTLIGGQGTPSRSFENDDVVTVPELVRGIRVSISDEVEEQSLRRGQSEFSKPVVRVVLALPWPLTGEAPDFWPERYAERGRDSWLLRWLRQLRCWLFRCRSRSVYPMAYRSVTLVAQCHVEERSIVWVPAMNPATWLNPLFAQLRRLDWPYPIEGRFQIDGWAVIAKDDAKKHLNGRVRAHLDATGHTRLAPTAEDEVTGGRFDQWFWLTPPDQD